MSIRFILSSLLVLSGATAQAAEFFGLTVNGEIAFDYSFLSTQSTNMLYSDGVSDETYRLRGAQFILSKETDQVYFMGRLNYAPQSVVTNVNHTDEESTTNTQNFGTLDQAEIFYKPAANFYIGFGRFLTTMGYESLMKYENATYGTTIAYQGIVPGYGEGLRAKYTAGNWLTATLSTYNQARYSAFGDDYTPTKATELSATGKLGDFTWFAGYLMGTDKIATGKEERTSSGVWASYQMTPELLIAMIYDSVTLKQDGGNTKWSDATTAQITYALGSNNLALRYEMVRGANELGYTGDTVNSLTIADKVVLNDHFNLYAEYRIDRCNKDSFVDDDGAPTDSASVITLGALAHF